MFKASGLVDELQGLRSEVSHLLNTAGDGLLDNARGHADALADQIKAALNEIGETLSENEDHVEALIAKRPVAVLASAFALGVAIGFMLRRH